MGYRFPAIAVALMWVSFAAIHWLLTPRQLMPDPRIPAFRQVDPAKHDPLASDNDEVRDALRREVQKTADDLLKNPCSDWMRDQYIAAATRYGRAWLSIAPCMEKCGTAQIERVQKAFNTPFDKTVRESMRQVHGTDIIREGDFGNDVIAVVAGMAHDGALNPKAEPAYRQREKENRTRVACRR